MLYTAHRMTASEVLLLACAHDAYVGAFVYFCKRQRWYALPRSMRAFAHTEVWWKARDPFMS